MNILTYLFHARTVRTAGSSLVLTTFILTGCAALPAAPAGSIEARNKLNALQNNAETASYARVELREADEAVTIAEQPLARDATDLAEHRIYMANTLVEIAREKAVTRKAEADRADMGRRLDAARLAARTAEADRAEAERADMGQRLDAAKLAASTAEANRAAADATRARGVEAAALAAATKESEALRQQILALEAKPTDRGLVLTLGDVLFASGSAEIQGGTNQNLERLASFLTQYPDRDVMIEGHTDNVGAASFNRTLSQQRADSVRRYLTDRRIASNDTATGRQQNRRVEVIIENAPQP